MYSKADIATIIEVLEFRWIVIVGDFRRQRTLDLSSVHILSINDPFVVEEGEERERR